MALFNFNRWRVPIFSGYFSINGMDSTAHRVPYVGMEFDVKSWGVWREQGLVAIDKTYNYYDSEGNLVNDPSKAILSAPQVYNPMTYPVDMLSFDLVAEKCDLLAYLYPPVEGVDGYHGPIYMDGLWGSHSGSSPLRF